MIKLTMSGKNGVKEYKIDNLKNIRTLITILAAGLAAIYLYRTAKEIDNARIAEDNESSADVED